MAAKDCDRPVNEIPAIRAVTLVRYARQFMTAFAERISLTEFRGSDERFRFLRQGCRSGAPFDALGLTSSFPITAKVTAFAHYAGNPRKSVLTIGLCFLVLACLLSCAVALRVHLLGVCTLLLTFHARSVGRHSALDGERRRCVG